MDTSASTYDRLIDGFVRWATSCDDVRAMLVIGSRARSDHPADVWSDLDLLVIAGVPELHWGTTDWLTPIGPVLLTHCEPTPDRRGMERRVLFAGGLDVDVAFLPIIAVDGMLADGLPPDAADVLRRGFRVLVDKDGLATRLPAAIPPALPPALPAESLFLNAVSDFWYHALWTARHLRRGELWWAKESCDGRLKGLLRQMLTWHAQATRGTDYDTWFGSRFLEEWADPRAVAALPDVFARYDTADVWRSLAATMTLFAWLAEETAAHRGFAYPRAAATATTELVHTLMPAHTGGI